MNRPSSDDIHEVLASAFGFEGFRPGQQGVVDDVLGGRPTVAVMPTGAGKSLCYQLPALLLDGLTLVVSPLIALMKDQVDGLRARGVAAAALHSALAPDERRQVRGALREGTLRLLYVAPERFRDPGFVADLAGVRVALLAVDEAHCISQWGHDFRPDYRQLRDRLATLEVARVAAFTATATPEVRRDIVRQLAMDDPAVHVTGFARPNLHLRVVPVRKMAQKARYIAALLDRVPDAGQGIVYAATRRHVEEVGARLAAAGHAAAIYHGGMADPERHAAQERFMGGEARVMVATNAFGMGVDKADLRFVTHYDIPGSLEAYYQEVGRAGRDGAPAECALLFTYADVRIQRLLIDRDREWAPDDGRPRPDPALVAEKRQRDRAKLQRMVRYAYAEPEECRHQILLRYFGDPAWREQSACRACDSCGFASPWAVPAPIVGAEAPARAAALPAELTEPRALDPAEQLIVRKALSCAARVRGGLTVTGMVRLLKGSKTAAIRECAWADSPSDGLLRPMREEALKALFRALADAGCLRRPWGTQKDVLVLTRLGRDVMMDERDVLLAMPPFEERTAAARRRAAEEATLGPIDPELFERLRARRRALADAREVPAYVVCSDATLRQIAATRPRDRDGLLACKGVGPVNVEVFADGFLEEIAAFGDG